MAEETSEKVARSYFESKDLRCERFSREEVESGERTPDFRVYKGDEFCFYCEVKSITRDRWIDSLFENQPAGTIVEGSRRPPQPNRITKDIRLAVKQFDAVNRERQYPNVLFFVNDPGSLCDYHELKSVLTGLFFADDGTRWRFYTKYAYGRIREARSRVDLYVWQDSGDEPKFLFWDEKSAHARSLCGSLDIDPGLIQSLFP